MTETIEPDRAEQKLGNLMDSAVPFRGESVVPVVGLGGSAGSVEALQVFFSSVPPDTGLAFVVVIHLSPEHDSILADVLRQRTSMRVIQVQHAEKIEPNVVYVIPPGHLLQSMDGEIQLGDMVGERGRNVAVDVFFRTLADTHGVHAAAIVLSGMDGDGSIGIKRIKERGGLTVVQDPLEAMHDSMPQNAIATSMVDWVLPVGEMASQLASYFALEPRLQLPPEKKASASARQEAVEAAEEDLLRSVLAFVQARTGRDFSCYKRATVLRRIARRMQVNGIENLADYLSCLRLRPAESGALVQDLLISVTNFFRDASSFHALERELPTLFAGKTSGDSIRVWVAATATGEEAYSLAILLSEYARNVADAPVIQVFATDLDAEAIKTARDGLYPMAIQADVSDEQLKRYFVRELHGYRIRREIREMVLFAVHDVLKDSPFSRLDLVSCRNLLIYLNRPAQQRLIDTFHFALVQDGLLFLGTSEAVDEQSFLFAVVDKNSRIFRRSPAARPALPMPTGPSSLALAIESRNLSTGGPVVGGVAFDLVSRPDEPAPEVMPRLSLGETHLKLLEQLSPPSILVDRNHDILHLSPKAGTFLHYKGGEPSTDLLRAVKPGMRVELRAALVKAGQSRLPVELDAADGEHDSSERVHIRVVPLHDGGVDYFLVSFEKRHEDSLSDGDFDAEGAEGEEAGPDGGRRLKRSGPDPIAGQLDREVERLKNHLRDTVQQFEASTEELKASNEELQAMNEELRSATEELETSREELQSINEELTTVNHELKSKVDQLGYANSDMQNLMDAAAIAIVFLDRRLCITRYTPAAVNLFHLIPTDIGRPLSDLTTKLMFPEMTSDAQRVLERLSPIEREVGQADGRCFVARLLPYRTLVEDRIAGVVLAFIDITERKHAEETRYWLAQVVAASADAIFSFSPQGSILSWNPGAEQMFGYAAADAIGQPLTLLDSNGAETSSRAMDALKLVDRPVRFNAKVRCANGQDRQILMSVSCMKNGLGQVMAGASIATPVLE